MMHDQYGRTIFRGDTVALTGRVVDLLDDEPDYVNCTVQLDQQMPPSGATIRLDLNTMQVVKTAPGEQIQPPSRLRPMYARLANERSVKYAALAAIGQSLTQVRQMLQRLMHIDQQLRQFE